MRCRLLVPPLLLLAGLGLAAACRARPPADPVQALVERGLAAAEERDVAALEACLDPAFRGGSLDRAAALAEARRWFFTYQSLDLELADLVLERPAEGRARANFRVVMSGRPKEIAGLADVLPRSAVYAFETEAALGADGQWRFTSAAWRDAEGEAPPTAQP